MAQFDFMSRVGASRQAVAVLNDQPQLFTTLVLVLLGLAAQCGFIVFIHFATIKPEQKKKKDTKGKTGGKTGGRLFGFKRAS